MANITFEQCTQGSAVSYLSALDTKASIDYSFACGQSSGCAWIVLLSIDIASPFRLRAHHLVVSIFYAIFCVKSNRSSWSSVKSNKT